MRFFKWAGIHPVAVVLVIAATVAVMLVVTAGDDNVQKPIFSDAGSPSPTPGRLISEPRLEGWSQSGAGKFEATTDEGSVRYSTRGGPGVLWFDEKLEDFELTLQVKVEEPSDSGVYVRLQTPDDFESVEDGLEIQITSEGEGPGEEGTGAIFKRESPFVYFTPTPGKWHDMRVRADGMQVFVWFDDILVTQFPSVSDPAAVDWGPTGYLGLQNNSGTVSFRDIRVLEL